MQDAGQEGVESNHTRAADACNGIARAIKEEGIVKSATVSSVQH